MVDLFAWVGLDERGSGEIGLKQHLREGSLWPAVGIETDPNCRLLFSDVMMTLMVAVHQMYGVSPSLCRFSFASEILTIGPSATVRTSNLATRSALAPATQLAELQLFAWMQAEPDAILPLECPMGLIPFVVIGSHLGRALRSEYVGQMKRLADKTGLPARLCNFHFAEEIKRAG